MTPTPETPPGEPGQPAPVDPDWPRYGARPFPPYRYVPGGPWPHPNRDPGGHRCLGPGEREGDHDDPLPRSLSAQVVEANGRYRHAIDLYNHAFWWEGHELLESLYFGLEGDETRARSLLKALIQLSAAHLHRFTDGPGGGASLYAKVDARLGVLGGGVLLGIDLGEMVARLGVGVRGDPPGRPLIALAHHGTSEPSKA